MQRLLDHARWDADAVRDALRAQVAGRLGDLAGVLVVDDTGLEEGPPIGGVQRQYTGAAGKFTNCRIGVFCSCANPDRERVPIDRELYLPKSRFTDPDRLADAGVPGAAVLPARRSISGPSEVAYLPLLGDRPGRDITP